MRKWTFAMAIAVATASLVGVGTQAQALVEPETQVVAAGAEFGVRVDCDDFNDFNVESVDFSFRGSTPVTVACITGNAETSFTAPLEAGTYAGTACPLFPLDLRTGLRFTGAQAVCVELLTFTVTVEGTVTTTAAPTTTLAPTTTIAPTTIAPATTAVAAVPPAPTTTAAPVTLPATGPDRTDGGIVIALALLAIGGGLIVATRWRKNTTTG